MRFSKDPPFYASSTQKGLIKEIASAHNILRKFEITPRAFRPPVGITNPRLGKVLDKVDMYNVNFSCRAINGGNRWIRKFFRTCRAADDTSN